MAKRTATTDLNHDNWDREDEPEDIGTFSKASEEALKKRVIKIAKRRNPISSHSEEEKSSIFGGFSGFSKTTSSPSKSFGFLTNITNKTDSSKTNGTASDKSDEYYAKLKGLNESVTEWIKKHVSTNPFINLQPIFRDYDKYIMELEKMNNDTATAKVEVSKSSSTTSTPQFSFTTTTTTTTTPPSVPKFSFGTTSTTPSIFSFGSGTSTFSSNSKSSGSLGENSISSSFTFGNPSSNGKFSFTSTTVKPADDANTEEDTEDEPPKTEFTPVVEEGHIYTIRCKVFVKKDNNFGDRGVGTLYLKPVPNSEKVQLIVRADTNIGNLTCNFILSEGIPIQRMGKKDVMLITLPTPDTKPPPVPILLRVKTTEDADELFNILQKHKK